MLNTHYRPTPSRYTHYMWWIISLVSSSVLLSILFLASAYVGNLFIVFVQLFEQAGYFVDPYYIGLFFLMLFTLPSLFHGVLRKIILFILPSLIILYFLMISIANTLPAFEALLHPLLLYILLSILPITLQSRIPLVGSKAFASNIVLVFLILLFTALFSFNLYLNTIFSTIVELNQELPVKNTFSSPETNLQLATQCNRLISASKIAAGYRSVYQSLCPPELFLKGAINKDQPWPLISDSDLTKNVQECNKISSINHAPEYPLVGVCIDKSPYLVNKEAWNNESNYMTTNVFNGGFYLNDEKKICPIPGLNGGNDFETIVRTVNSWCK